MDIRNGTLYIDDCNTVELAKRYGTPLYVVSLSEIKARVDEMKTALKPYPKSRIAYAAKAFLSKGMVRILDKLDLCLDVVSGGELDTALATGFPPERIEFNGNNKLEWELELAISNGIGRIIIDGYQELDLIRQIARRHNSKVSVLIRLTPGVAADSHDYIVTGKKDSKFGFPLDAPELMQTISEAMADDSVDLIGFHFHVGSQLDQNKVYLDSLELVFRFLEDLNQQTGFIPREMNIGGGFGIRYTDEDDRKPFSFYLEPIMAQIRLFFDRHDWELPELVTEPGRSIIGEAGTTLYTIGILKDISGLRYYACVDGGMNDNIRPALYQAKYNAVLANRADAQADTKVTITGKICESGDILIKDIALPSPKRGDILAVFSTGAYGHSMASNYNKLPVPAVVLVYKGRSELLVRRQTLEDLRQYDMIPELVEQL
ncbi:MAG TPA: diaminopimelate decarboxylase [Tissierellia bacterium]|nr:diaminopimelate decarboxylase [Tissierellia bacterium]